MRTFTKLFLVLALAVVICLPGVASADTVWLFETGVTPGTGLSIYADGLGGPFGAQAGNYILSVGPTSSGPFTSISSYCVEPVYSDTAGYSVYTVVPITPALNTLSQPNAYAAYAAAAWLVSKGYTGDAAVTAQAAVWELTWDYRYGRGFDLATGDFRLYTSPPTVGDVQTDYNAARAAVAAGWDPSAYVLYESADYQDYVGRVPVPPSVLLLGSGLLGLVGLGWRRARKES